MSNTTLILGPVVLDDFEVIAGIGFGGAQRLAVHQLPGGVRVIDSLGRDDADITFSGIFSGTNATWRARAVDQLRAAGLPLPLIWDVFFYTVIIRDFSADYFNGNWVPYRLTCTVLRDETSAALDLALSAATSVVADLASAAAQPLLGIDLTGTQSALAAPQAMVPDTASYGLATTSLQGTQATIASGLDQSGGTLDQAGLALGSTNDPAAGAGALGQATSAAGQLGSLAAARAYVGRAMSSFLTIGP
jgi:hypothetical protein